jgi:ribonucleotide reductase alpha subunit
VKRLEILEKTELNSKSRDNVEKVAKTAKEELEQAKTKFWKKKQEANEERAKKSDQHELANESTEKIVEKVKQSNELEKIEAAATGLTKSPKNYNHQTEGENA